MFAFDQNATPYDLSFRVGQTPVRVNPFFWLMAALLGWNYTQGPGGNFGYLFLWIACVFFSVLLHELGHVWTGRLFGSRGHILLYSFGGLAFGSSDQRARWQRILVYFAGPGIQFILYGLVWGFASWAFARWGFGYIHVWVVVSMLLSINWYWPLLNLLPIWPLDGGRITREVCEAVSPRQGVPAAMLISAVVSGILAVHCLLAENGRGLPILERYVPGSLYMGIFFALFCVGSIQAYQQERARSRSWHDDYPWER